MAVKAAGTSGGMVGLVGLVDDSDTQTALHTYPFSDKCVYYRDMQLESSQKSRTLDRRVVRSRSTLMAAAVRLVSERGTTAIPVTDLAEAANVSRQLVYLQFGDRDSLFVETAVDLVRRELLPQFECGVKTPLEGTLAMVRHFTGHRSFYRAMMTGSCAFSLNRALDSTFSSHNKQFMRELFGEEMAEDMGRFISGGTSAIVNHWLIEATEPVDPEELTDRLVRVHASIFADYFRADGGRVQ